MELTGIQPVTKKNFMRIYLKLTPNTEKCPFNYQQNLVGAFHKWIGKNDIHDQLSLYSMSWFSPGKNIKGKYLNFSEGATWFISSPNPNLIKQLIMGIRDNPSVAFGMFVNELVIQQTPTFGNSVKFQVATPVLVQRTLENKRKKQYGFDDGEVDDLLTETLKNKLIKAEINSEGVKVQFDKDYPKPIRKKITYKGIGNLANICPVIIDGPPEAIAFAWAVGVGNSTGIGFGALK